MQVIGDAPVAYEFASNRRPAAAREDRQTVRQQPVKKMASKSLRYLRTPSRNHGDSHKHKIASP